MKSLGEFVHVSIRTLQTEGRLVSELFCLSGRINISFIYLENNLSNCEQFLAAIIFLQTRDPKLSTILDIANYFGISLEKFISSELTVNDVIGFDVFENDASLTASSALHPTLPNTDFIQVPLVTTSSAAGYFKEKNFPGFIQQLPVLQLPLQKGYVYRAFEIAESAFTDGPQKGDIIVGKNVALSPDHPLLLNKIMLVETSQSFIFRQIADVQGQQITLSGTHPFLQPTVMQISDIVALWSVEWLLRKSL